MSFIEYFKMKVLRYTNPALYWKKRGLTIGLDCEVYSSASFGSIVVQLSRQKSKLFIMN